MSHRPKRDVIVSQYLELMGNTGDLESYHILNDLRRCVDFFLCESYQKDKFNDPLFSSIIQTSADSCPEFSGKLAAQCFDTLEKIAKNIISFKWRRSNEYATISINTPFYLYKLTQTLFGYERILENLGYIFVEKEQLWRLKNVEEKETMKFIDVAIDCFVASVECQIIETIKRLVSGKKNVNWSKIIACRTKMAGGAEKCAEFLLLDVKKSQINTDLITFPNINRNSSFTDIKKKQAKPSTKWYTENTSEDDSLSRTLPKTTKTKERSLTSYHTSTLPVNNSTKFTRLPRIDAQQNYSNHSQNEKRPVFDQQNYSSHSKNEKRPVVFDAQQNYSNHSKNDKRPVSSSTNSSTILNSHSYLNNLDDLKEKIGQLRQECVDAVDRECPRCRMINHQKNFIICSFCGYYFPV